MTQSIVLGLVQGIAEWLPVSSEGMLVLTQQTFFGVHDFEQLITQALILHLGTFFAALVYFWKDVVIATKALFNYKNVPSEQKNLIRFLITTTLISGVIGLALLASVEQFFESTSTGKGITALVGLFLLITAWLQFKAKDAGKRTVQDITINDQIVLGIAQGCAALPGLSRSGLTVAALLLKKFDKETALKLSFLMSLPIVLGGNIILNAKSFVWSQEMILAVIIAFISGLITIHVLLKVAKKINFGYFVLLFAILTLLSVFV